MSDKKISEAVELLYKGGKMLSYHCPDCMIPLFEKDGRIFCPSCGREAVFEGDEGHSLEEERGTKVEVEKAEIGETKRRDEDLQEVRGDYEKGRHADVADDDVELEMLVKKAAARVCEMIISSRNPKEVRDLVRSLDTLVRIIRRL